ncbi:inactive rhomboid protein 1-like, partial [Trifolium medium]|nr:inactive rhomboid protein 1-like [Trifolium medium]
MYVNNCPRNSVSCIARFLHRFSFQPFKENPLLGPSSLTCGVDSGRQLIMIDELDCDLCASL